MYNCKPLSYLPIQSDRDFARAEVGDTVLIPERHFERLFGEFLGGVLGIRLEFHAAATVAIMYATAAPQTEENDSVFLPDWLIWTLEQRQFSIAELQCEVKKAEPLGKAATIVARPIATVEEGVDLRSELETALYDNHYVHAQTIVHVPSGDIWIESVLDSESFEMEVGELGDELALEIQESPGVAEAQEAARVAEAAAAAAARVAAVDPATVRAARLRYFEKKN